MSPEREITTLAERKRLLLLESQLHRNLIALECQGLRARLDTLDNLRARLSRLNPWLLAGAGTAGLLAAGRWRSLLRWLPAALAAWRWLQRLRPD